ncbi:hypothetical protein GCM10017750_67910 [Streptomyces racemochromogenes]
MLTAATVIAVTGPVRRGSPDELAALPLRLLIVRRAQERRTATVSAAVLRAAASGGEIVSGREPAATWSSGTPTEQDIDAVVSRLDRRTHRPRPGNKGKER